MEDQTQLNMIPPDEARKMLFDFPVIVSENLHENIAALIGNPFFASAKIFIAPNCDSAVVTRLRVAEMPSGYMVILIFNEQNSLPEDHIEGQIYQFR